MMYELFQKNIYDGRATEDVFLDDDYEFVSDIEADSLKDVSIRIALRKDSDEAEEEDIKEIRVGDVLRDPAKKCWIWTPMGVWATVQAFENQ